MAAIEAIKTIYVEADVSSVTFGSIPGTYDSLQLRASGKDGATGNYSAWYCQFNSDSGSNYTHHFYYGFNSTANGTSDTPCTQARMYGMASSDRSPQVDEAAYGVLTCDLHDYADTAKKTTWRYVAGAPVELGGTIAWFGAAGGGLWNNTSAVTSWTLGSQTGGALIRRGTTLTLYGLRNS